MPGSIGGAVWMNARCYGSEIADVLAWAEIVGNERLVVSPKGAGFGYKLSPFQKMDALILWACFNLTSGEEGAIRGEMEKTGGTGRKRGTIFFPARVRLSRTTVNLASPQVK
jgi:UDP-N-acetylmuramate dehydrogenase